MSDLIKREEVIKGIKLSCLGKSDVIQAECAILRYIEKIPSEAVGRRSMKDKMINRDDVYAKFLKVKEAIEENNGMFIESNYWRGFYDGMARAMRIIREEPYKESE